jgi:hypothetical protein
MRDPAQFEEMQERVDAEIRKQKRIARTVMLFVNILMFVIFTMVSFSILGDTPEIATLSDSARDALTASTILMTIGWATGIFFQGMSTFFDSGLADTSMRRRAITRVMGDQLWEASEQYRRLQSEKPKRDPTESEGRLVLGEDGELVEIEEQAETGDYFEDEQPGRQQRLGS